MMVREVGREEEGCTLFLPRAYGLVEKYSRGVRTEVQGRLLSRSEGRGQVDKAEEGNTFHAEAR